jgi:putative ABC transport system permease protein
MGTDESGRWDRGFFKRLFDRRWWNLSRREILADIDEEFRLHLEMRAEVSEAEGMLPEAAQQDAELRFGDYGSLRERGARILLKRERTRARASFVDGLVQDLRFAIRMALRTPTVTGLAVIALALGIGANTAMFSVVDAVLRPNSSIPDADRIVVLTLTGDYAGGVRGGVGADRYFDYRDNTDAFEQFLGFQIRYFLLEGSLRASVGLIAPAELFDLLGVQPILGRTFSREEYFSKAPTGENLEMLLTYDTWQGKFGGDSAVVGRVVHFDPQFNSSRIMARRAALGVEDTSWPARTIVGVLPRGFQLPLIGAHGSLDRLSFEAVVPFSEGKWVRDDRRLHVGPILGKLREDFSLEQARAQFATVDARIGAQYPDEATYAAQLDPITKLPRVYYGRALLLLWAVIVSILLIACLNVASLVLARTVTRDGESAIRYSLGGGRRRIVRQLVTESLLLAAAGGAVGVGVGWASTRAAVALFPGSMHGLAEASINLSVLGTTVLLSLATVLFFGLAPAVAASRVNLVERLKGISRGYSLNSSRIFHWLVGIEVALALVLFLGTGLLLNSFIRLSSIELGFDPDQILAVRISLPEPEVSKYGNGEEQIPEVDLHDRIMESVEAIPGVSGSSIATWAAFPLQGGNIPIAVEGRADHRLDGNWGYVSPGYFGLMGIPLLAGRAFGPPDMSDQENVAVVSASAARKFWPDADPLGKRLGWGYYAVDNENPDDLFSESTIYTVVGVVGDVTGADLAIGPGARVYSPTAHVPWEDARSAEVVVLTGDPRGMAEAVRQAVLGVDEAEIEVRRVVAMTDRFSQVRAQPRFYLFMLGSLAAVALVLVLSGVYGVLAYTVNRRRPELGLRMALGAHPAAVRGMMLRQGLIPVALGATVGLALTLYLGQFLTSYLYGVRPADPLTAGVTLALVLGMAALACYLPARRASTVDPVEALRME